MSWFKKRGPVSPLEKSAVTNPGGDAYEYGVSGTQGMIWDTGPNSIPIELEDMYAIDAGSYAPAIGQGPGSYNLPPLMKEGTAQRTRPGPLGLVEFTPIGPGEVHLRDIRPCAPSQQVYELAAWAQGLGQVANQIALVYAAGQAQGDGVVQGAGVNQLPYALPSDFSVAYATDQFGLPEPYGVPNASGYPFPAS